MEGGGGEDKLRWKEEETQLIRVKEKAWLKWEEAQLRCKKEKEEAWLRWEEKESWLRWEKEWLRCKKEEAQSVLKLVSGYTVGACPAWLRREKEEAQLRWEKEDARLRWEKEEAQLRWEKEDARLRWEKEDARLRLEEAWLRWEEAWLRWEGELELRWVEEELQKWMEAVNQQILSSLVSKGVSLSLSEMISMDLSSPLPLDSVGRIQSSKFWMMECDVYADLLIICRWANPTATWCDLCNKHTEKGPTQCGHEACVICVARGIVKQEYFKCPDCGQKLGMVPYFVLHNDSVQPVTCSDEVHSSKRLRSDYAFEDEEMPCSKRPCTENSTDDREPVEYRLLLENYTKLKEALSTNPKDVAELLFQRGIIPKRVLDETNELPEIKADKAS